LTRQLLLLIFLTARRLSVFVLERTVLAEDQTFYTSPFDAIRRVDADGIEYWSARDLSKVLGYDDYRNLLKVIAKAKAACQQSQQAVADHFLLRWADGFAS
jgi:hypothetical protein